MFTVIAGFAVSWLVMTVIGAILNPPKNCPTTQQMIQDIDKQRELNRRFLGRLD
jgi:hypothetical protein